MSCDSSFGSRPSEMVVKPRTSENSTVSLAALASMENCSGFAAISSDQFRRHVLAEQSGDLALGARLDEEAVGHVEREQHQRSSAARRPAAAPGCRLVQTRRLVADHRDQHDRPSPAVARNGFSNGSSSAIAKPGQQQQDDLGAEHIGRLLLDGAVEHARRSGWRGSPPRDRRGATGVDAQVQQARRRGARPARSCSRDPSTATRSRSTSAAETYWKLPSGRDRAPARSRSSSTGMRNWPDLEPFEPGVVLGEQAVVGVARARPAASP